MVCLSGGKDSYALLDVLLSLREHAPDRLRARRGQPRPGATRASRRMCCRDYLDALGVPFRIVAQDTYSVVKRVIPEGKTMCCAVLAAAARRPLPRRRASSVHQDRARPPPRRHPRDPVPEPVLRRQAQGDAAQAGDRDDGDHVVIRPLAYVARSDLAPLRRAAAVPHHPVRPVRLAGEAAAQAGEGDARRVGEALSRAAPRPCSAACQREPSHLLDARCSISPACAPTGVPVAGAIWPLIPSRCPRTVVPLRRVDAALKALRRR